MMTRKSECKMRWLRFLRGFKDNQNVVKLSDYTPKRERRNHCSICSNKVKAVVHYAGPQGNVIGVCASCKNLADRRGFFPI